jgi:BirA family transcriptional regulator, biotin operon repressor / biotin---[acetyl-CoA-carboxylase] ligase
VTATADRRPPTLVRLDVVDSTQTVAATLADAGAPDLTAVVAEHQTAGRGRYGRAWLDEPGANLLLSIVLRPRLPVDRFPTLGLAVGVAVVDALARSTGVRARLKWPNDVLLDGRKLAGILLESRLGPPPAVLVGIGLNVAQERFPVEVAGQATSLALAGVREVDRERLLAAVLEAVDDWRRRLEQQGFAPVRARWCALADTLGRAVTIDGVAGTAVELDDGGALVVDDGTRRRRVVAGDVRALDPGAGGD